MSKRRGMAARQYAVRRAWLEEYGVDGLPSFNEDVDEVNGAKLTEVHEAMRSAGLFGRRDTGSYGKTSQRETIRRLVSEIRREHVTEGQW